MKNVIIFGTGKSAETLELSLNCNVNIIAYTDNNNYNWGKMHRNKLVINPLELIKYEYDYILIGSQFNEEIYKQLLDYKIPKSKIFQLTKYTINNWDYIKYNKERISNDTLEINTLVTGSSYSTFGFAEEFYKKKAINISAPSQDLYYDFNFVKWAIENNNLNNLQEVIIGLSYYSFQYDMSLSAMKGNVSLYYRNLGLKHNLNNIEDIIEGLDETLKIGDNIFNFKSSYVIWKGVSQRSILNEETGRIQAEVDCRKNYPETVKENIQIFKNYLELLIEKNVKPIVVVYPVSKYYSMYFSSIMKAEFKSIINQMKKIYEFEYIDYFNNDIFSDENFRDVSHLNIDGGKKFTEILNNLIK
ncbi:hypothetical protein [Clostridium saccharoperbutylacetonicum]|uniref:hypothetical protein n=1 Tax=Clostridium saccharoperbutylacetonicum TaxID=36745 RepID=UPI000983A514|nr:hypothetical protein [Clostridium saccharoperbutylacetonicum]AQR96990.1 hypothetical protein CLSAP_43140 [Clostridium saccharoperbutylacetonicum]NSB32869.1 hypothetical protein [Clostridium saccharoperbutylacetonicum]